MIMKLEQFKIYVGGVIASVWNMTDLSVVNSILQIVLTVVVIWYTIKKIRNK